MVQCQLPWVACEQALRGTLAAGREKEGKLATTSLELQFPCGSPSTELLDFRQSAQSGNERKCKQTLKARAKVMTSLLMSSPPISISYRLFRRRHSNFRDVVAKKALLLFPAPPSEHAGELAPTTGGNLRLPPARLLSIKRSRFKRLDL